jgi:hypothetical protein
MPMQYRPQALATIQGNRRCLISKGLTVPNTTPAIFQRRKEGAQVTLSHLEFAIEAGEDFERDVNGAGSTEALNGYF